jgi:orotate phosphoribosyltransferase
MTTRPLREYDGSTERYWYVSEVRYFEALQALVAAVRALEPRPDSVVGIKRSGLFPAVVISHQLKLPMFTDGEAKVYPYPKFQLPVVVDTTVWSGASARRVQARLKRRGVEQVPVFAIWVREDPLPAVNELNYLAVCDRIMHFWYDEETE